MDHIMSLIDGDIGILELMATFGQWIYENKEMIQLEIHIILSALFPIYIGSHASLQRPPSAAPPPKRSRKNASDDEDQRETHTPMEGLTPSDAILFPVLASVALGSLYLIIKWLEDPALLNKILGWYFSALGVVGVGKLAGDALHVATGFIFPSAWSDGKDLYTIDPLLRVQVPQAKARFGLVQPSSKTNPLPGFLSSINFPKPLTSFLWTTRSLLKSSWVLRLHIKNIIMHKSTLTLSSILGFLIGLTTIISYNVFSQPWFLTNLMGFGFCYGTLQLMSPTTFATGSLVLLGLFFYDITMVFYTPLMVTVATSLDVPIKLVFPTASGSSMLGLGDIVLPGILVALALRFDLYLHYLRISKSSSSTLKSSPKSDSTSTRPSYKPATGLWGERFWTSSSPAPSVPSSHSSSRIAAGTRFKKVYFKTAIVGYIIGMITTLVVLNVFHHAQPALLYLVPGVVGSLWGVAWVRGEVGVMWGYTEDGSLDVGEDDDKEKKDVDQDKKEQTDGKDVQVVKENVVGDKTNDNALELSPWEDSDEDEEEDEDTPSEHESARKDSPAPHAPRRFSGNAFTGTGTLGVKDGNDADDEGAGGPGTAGLAAAKGLTGGGKNDILNISQEENGVAKIEETDKGKGKKKRNKKDITDAHLPVFSLTITNTRTAGRMGNQIDAGIDAEIARKKEVEELNAKLAELKEEIAATKAAKIKNAELKKVVRDVVAAREKNAVQLKVLATEADKMIEEVTARMAETRMALGEDDGEDGGA
ncbi:Signal peptide peptidase protein [Rutstroemia sp. NJR-2017a WRK4]|nr:Signal peptide peptidase protein [Rutstroemia sp. NJR-2017a WRK4]